MKKILTVLIFVLFTFQVWAQNQKDTLKVQFDVILPGQESIIDPPIVGGVFSYIIDYLVKFGYLLGPDERTLDKILSISEKNEDFAFTRPTKQSAIDGLFVLLAEETTENGVRFRLTHTNLKGESLPYHTDTYSMDVAKSDIAQKHAACSLIGQCLRTKELDAELSDLNGRLVELQDQINKELEARRAAEEEELRAKMAKEKEEQRKYTLRSFLPPVNQFSSPTSSGTVNGIAIVSGYVLSIGGFIWCTASYNNNRRRYDNVSIDLTEADKARAYYKGQMDICRGGQIASAILFAGTYIYGVANALANRDAFRGITKDTSMKIAPVAYDNGAGIALVYKF